jgi:hypothetical protein
MRPQGQFSVVYKSAAIVAFFVGRGNGEKSLSAIKNISNKMVQTSGHFLRIRQWGGHLQKGTILYQVWRNDRWLLVTKSLV